MSPIWVPCWTVPDLATSSSVIGCSPGSVAMLAGGVEHEMRELGCQVLGVGASHGWSPRFGGSGIVPSTPSDRPEGDRCRDPRLCPDADACPALMHPPLYQRLSSCQTTRECPGQPGQTRPVPHGQTRSQDANKPGLGVPACQRSHPRLVGRKDQAMHLAERAREPGTRTPCSILGIRPRRFRSAPGPRRGR